MSRDLLLKSLIDSRFGGSQTDFARAIKRSPAQVNQWLTGHRKLGDAGARTIELALNLPAGYFDRTMTNPEHGAALALEACEPADDWTIREILRLLRTTDAGGRMMALGAVRAALAGYAGGS